MTPHELINLPYAGMAEKQLRKQGDWHIDPMEKLGRSIDEATGAVVMAQDFLEQAEYDYRKAMEALEE